MSTLYTALAIHVALSLPDSAKVMVGTTRAQIIDSGALTVPLFHPHKPITTTPNNVAPATLQKVIVVYGATGTQGTAITLSLLQSKQNFAVRALTRKPESKKAQRLSALGAEVVKADWFNNDEMKAALKNAWGFWLNTHHHDPAVTDPEGPTDEDLGRRLVSLAAEAGVKVFIYSTCESPAKITNGKAPVPGMDAKSRVEHFARTIPSFDAVIGAWPAWYFENFIDPEYARAFGGFPLLSDDEGYYTFTSPRVGGQGTVQTVSVADDFGEMVHAMFLNPLRWAGCTVPCMSDAFSYEVTGKKARYIPMDSYRDFPTHDSTVLAELQDVYRYMQSANGGFFGKPDDVETCQRLKDEARRDKGLAPQRVTTMREYFVRHYGGK
ncbi:NmrA-like family protein [Aspergillus keveii]|uniref:NmrA-like family protein n=1 Tax=Aspergillus keveii TaxID=714993 RepID=A0ABR4FRY6_9EURO